MLHAEFNPPDRVEAEGTTSWAIATYTCTSCGDEFPVELIEVMGHWDYGPGQDDRCPRCGRSGSEDSTGQPDIFDRADEHGR